MNHTAALLFLVMPASQAAAAPSTKVWIQPGDRGPGRAPGPFLMLPARLSFMFYVGFRRENFQKLELEKNRSQRLFLASQLLQRSLPLLKEPGGRGVTQLSLWLLSLSKLL